MSSQNRMITVVSAQPDELEVVVERRHPEHPPAGGAERHDLHDHRGHLDDEQRAEHDGSSSVRLVTDSPAIRPPSASEPVSPMKIRAGAAFHHRKPMQAPAVAAATSARSSGSRTL